MMPFDFLTGTQSAHVIEWDTPLARVVWSLLLGVIVGLEREITQKSAGLRTHILVCMGAAVFTLISTSILSNTSGGLVSPVDQTLLEGATLNRDPSRIAAQVVSGIGFIGGGAVLRHGATVKGLTTAASLWIMASIGMLAGIGNYTLSTITAILTFFVLFLIGHLEQALLGKHTKGVQVLASLSVEASHAKRVIGWLEKTYGNAVNELTSSSVVDSNITHITCLIDSAPTKPLNVHQVAQKLEELDNVVSISVRTTRADE
ncbi:MAG: MgtC/SapB family protein [Vampirovibrionales bacterium]|nr:MgtC/SapB family protein [Vampirovibrionales bacterium]